MGAGKNGWEIQYDNTTEDDDKPVDEKSADSTSVVQIGQDGTRHLCD